MGEACRMTLDNNSEAMDTLAGFHVRLHLSDGSSCLWVKQGRVHVLRPELGPMWQENFNRAIFQALPDGRIVPAGSDRTALDISDVSLEPIPLPN